jgi:hypothetical protein
MRHYSFHFRVLLLLRLFISILFVYYTQFSFSHFECVCVCLHMPKLWDVIGATAFLYFFCLFLIYLFIWLFIYGLLTDAVSTMKNLKGFGWKRSRPVSEHYLDIRLERLSKTTKYLSEDSRCLGRDSKRWSPNTRQQRYHLSQLVPYWCEIKHILFRFRSLFCYNKTGLGLASRLEMEKLG